MDIKKVITHGLLFFIIFSTGLLAYILSVKNGTRDEVTEIHELETIDNCIENSIKIINPSIIDNYFLHDTIIQCSERLNKQADLNDFYINRLKFYQQTYDEQIILWMVVIITIASVALAGFQIFVSYQLALIGKSDFSNSSEVLIESKKISLKSSITGVFILFLSFGFFIVFVYHIYKIENCRPNTNIDKANDSAQSIQISTGKIENNKSNKKQKNIAK